MIHNKSPVYYLHNSYFYFIYFHAHSIYWRYFVITIIPPVDSVSLIETNFSTQITRQSPPCPQVFVSLMQLFNLWLCGAINSITYRIVTGIFWEILQIATFGDPMQRKKGIVRFQPNYPFYLDKWSERKDSNLRLPAPKAGALPGCATLRKKTRAVVARENCGAKDGTWTHGHLGHNQVLYLLSYFRHGKIHIRRYFFFCKHFFHIASSGFYLEK